MICKRTILSLVVIIMCAGILVLPLSVGTYAHDVGLELDGEATVINGNVQPSPYAHMESYQESQSIIVEMEQNGNAKVTVLYARFNGNKEQSQYMFSDRDSEEYALFEQEVIAMMQSLANDASSKTERDMIVSLDNTRHSYDNSQGQALQFMFTWENLGEVHDNGTIVVTEPFATDHDAFTERREDSAHFGSTSFTAPYGGSGEDEYRYTLAERGSSDGAVESSRTGISSVQYAPEDSLTGARFVMSPGGQETPPETEEQVTDAQEPNDGQDSTESALPFPLAIGALVLLLLISTVVLVLRKRGESEE